MHFLQKIVWSFAIINTIIFIAFISYIIYGDFSDIELQKGTTRQVSIVSLGHMITYGSDTNTLGEKNKNPNANNGRGFILNNTQIITAAHVVDKLGSQSRIVFFDGTTQTGTVLKIDSQNDLALVSFPQSLTQYSQINISGHKGEKKDKDYSLLIGQKRISIVLENYTSNKTFGAFKYSGLLSSITPVESGDSGSALLNNSGELVALLIGKQENQSYYIPISHSSIFD